MLYNLYNKFSKRNGRNYFIFCIWTLIISAFWLKRLGWPLGSLGYVYPFVLSVEIIGLLCTIFEYFIILRLLKIKINFRTLHKQIAIIKIVQYVIRFSFSIALYNYEIVWRIFGIIFEMIAVVCSVYVIRKSYEISNKKVIVFAAIEFLLQCVNCVVMLHKH